MVPGGGLFFCYFRDAINITHLSRAPFAAILVLAKGESDWET